MELYVIRDYSVGALGGYSFVFGNGDGKCGVVPRNTHLNSHKFDYWIDGGDFVSSQSSDCSSMSNSNKDRSYY